jgi:hypothetical protein
MTWISQKVVKKKKKESEENAARTVTIIPIIFFICHVPVVYRITTSFIAAIFILSKSSPPQFFVHSFAAKHYINMIFHFVLLSVNSCVNPLVYLTGSKKLQQHINNCISKFAKPFAKKNDNCQGNPRDRFTKQTIVA